MPSVHSSIGGGRSLRAVGGGVEIHGLTELLRALKHTDGELRTHLRKELGAIADYVRKSARSAAPKRSGALEASVRKSVTQKGASIWSGLPYSLVQDRGGRVGRHHATLLTRASVSHYMTRAVQDAQPEISHRLQGLLQAIERDFAT